MRDNPALANKPIAVGGSPLRRGVVATCNYEARKYGIHSAMAAATARKRCPDLIIIRPDMEKYRQASKQIHEVFQAYTSLIEPLSLDEAFLDVSNSLQYQGSATRIAEAIRKEVKQSVNITISAGIAPNKFLAKIASDWNKPDGQFVITPDQVDEFVRQLPVKKLPGVGKVTAGKMNRLGINTCDDLRQLTVEQLSEHFGSFGERLHNLSLGIDDRPVQTERTRKSVSVENTYATDLPNLASCLQELPDLRQQLNKRLEGISGDYQIHKQFIKIKFHDFIQTTVEMISDTINMENFESLCEEGFSRGGRPVRLLGMGVRVIPRQSTNPENASENDPEKDPQKDSAKNPAKEGSNQLALTLDQGSL